MTTPPSASAKPRPTSTPLILLSPLVGHRLQKLRNEANGARETAPSVILDNKPYTVLSEEALAKLQAYTERLEDVVRARVEWTPVCEAWKRDPEAMNALADMLSGIQKEGFRREDERDLTRVEVFNGGTSPITGQEYGSYTMLVLWRGRVVLE